LLSHDAHGILVSLPLNWQRCHFFLDKASGEAIKNVCLSRKGRVSSQPAAVAWRFGSFGDSSGISEFSYSTRGLAWLNMFTGIQGQELVNCFARKVITFIQPFKG
jgi:hypothetical protein